MYSLKKTLDKFYREYNFKERLKHDPVEFPHRYSGAEDMEVAGFIASAFSYGRVELFKPVIEQILKPGGKRPSIFIKNFSLKKDSTYFKGINYRFNKSQDVICFIYLTSEILKQWGSIKNLITNFYRRDHVNIRFALEGCMEYILHLNTSPVYGRNLKPYGLTQLLPSPKKGSACKRINLFLRWMIRDKDIDLGVWNSIPPSKLIIPLDTHIARIARCLVLTKRTSTDWKTAEEITESLKKFDPVDPVKYDFALCHHGISGLCKGERSRSACASCNFYG